MNVYMYVIDHEVIRLRIFFVIIHHLGHGDIITFIEVNTQHFIIFSENSLNIMS